MRTDELVRNVMTREVKTVSPEVSMLVVRDLFKLNRFHHLPVVEGEQVVGMISRSDYFKLQHGMTLFKTRKSEEVNDAIFRSILVREVMSQPVITLNPDDTLSLAAAVFRENLFHALPVVEGEGRLLGILTTFDLLDHAYSPQLRLESS